VPKVLSLLSTFFPLTLLGEQGDRTMANDKDDRDARFKRANQFAHTILSTNQSYHAHKERMAHAALLIQVAIFGAIMTMHDWPPKWVQSVPAKILAFLAFLLLWVSLHVYIRWQLGMRRQSAALSAAIRLTLTNWLIKTTDQGDLERYQKDEKKEKEKAILCWHHFIPRKLADIPSEDVRELYPKAIAEEWEKQAKDGTLPIRAEWLLTGISIAMFAVIILRIILN